MKKILLMLCIVSVIIVAGCSTQIANPASKNCIDKGGSLEIITAADGSQSGLCTLKDGTKCDEWAYFRGECPSTQIANPASVNCINNGGTLKIVDGPDGQYGMCTLPGGKLCEEWSYFRGECPSNCTTCRQLVSPGPEYCKEGRIVSGGVDACGCNLPPKCEAVACTMDAKMCPDGSAVGREGPNCEFAPCPRSDEIIIGDKHYCRPVDRKAEVCQTLWQPVCGWFDSSIQCIKYPCAITSGNSCEACINPNVEYWTDGECPK